MIISHNAITFMDGNVIHIKTGTKDKNRMDYIISMLSDIICSALRHMNHPNIWKDPLETISIDLPLKEGMVKKLFILNKEGNMIQVFLDNQLMEETDELEFAKNFLQNVRNDMDELLVDFKKNPYIFLELKADTRADLNHLESAIDHYQL